MDSKGRFRLPAGIAEQFGEADSYTFVFNRGLGKCLRMFPENVWEKETSKIESELDELDPDDAAFKRAFYGGARKLTTDGSFRINLPDFLLRYAGISKEVDLVCMNQTIEVWATEEYEKSMMMSPEEFIRVSKKASKKSKQKKEDA